MSDNQVHDPLNFMRNLWGNMGFTLPGMVAPTFDIEELDKRIKDMKAVEGWLRMNLSMLQMTIQGLEIQRATLVTLQSMSQATGGSEPDANVNPFANPALWPWNFMQPAAAGQAPGETATVGQPEAKAPSAGKAKP